MATEKQKATRRFEADEDAPVIPVAAAAVAGQQQPRPKPTAKRPAKQEDADDFAGIVK